MKQTYIIAEAGVNHNGSLSMAIQLVDAASDAEPMRLNSKPLRQAIL